ncbi:MAG: D-alanyl-D-alanine carboxypeptidase [Gammaproteobacteria bacterium]|nr:D-alanyl-D-alanine carboxypeptidase [Gammaproteobacteria bacterium]
MLIKIQRILVLLLIALPMMAQTAPRPVPKAPAIGARSFILQDYNSAYIIAAKDAEQPMEPASITKMMTAYVIFKELKAGNIKLTDKVTISERAWRMEGSRMFIEVGKKVLLEDLIKGMIIQSGNDATVALAEYTAGDEITFAALMNQHAVALDMVHTHFVNSTGWPDPEHITTAADIAKLARALISEFPEYYSWYSEKKFTFNNITQYNRNKLLWRDPSVDGLKTGHTDSAGYCLVTSAKRGEMRLISVVLGTESKKARTEASQALLNYGFRFFETHKPYSANTELTTTRVWQGTQEKLALGLMDDLYITIPRGEHAQVKAILEIDEQIIAPVTTGQKYGSLDIQLHDKIIKQQPLIALQAVKEGSLWQVISDKILLYFE